MLEIPRQDEEYEAKQEETGFGPTIVSPVTAIFKQSLTTFNFNLFTNLRREEMFPLIFSVRESEDESFGGGRSTFLVMFWAQKIWQEGKWAPTEKGNIKRVSFSRQSIVRNRKLFWEMTLPTCFGAVQAQPAVRAKDWEGQRLDTQHMHTHVQVWNEEDGTLLAFMFPLQFLV